MVNTRAKIKKTQNTCFDKHQDSDQQCSELGPGALIGSIDDLLIEILLRLPATSIIRFKSVSKHWQWLLSQRHFTLRYDTLSKSPGLFIYNNYVQFDSESRSPLPFRTLDFHPDQYGIIILQSCNGLLLCCSHMCPAGYRKYYVFNPTTKQFATIPWPPGPRKTIRFMVLAFHPTNCVHYKVVCIRRIEPEYQILMYSSDTGKWKMSIESFASDFPIFDRGVYWNGAIYWPPTDRNHLYFKIDVQQLLMLPLPLDMESTRSFTTYLGESRGHFHLILTSYSPECNKFNVNVYEMLGDHSGWFVKYQVDLDPLVVAFPKMIHFYGDNFDVDYDVIDVVRGEKEEETFMVMVVRGKIITYNVHDKSFKKISKLSKYYGQVYLTFNRYIEALTPF